MTTETVAASATVPSQPNVEAKERLTGKRRAYNFCTSEICTTAKDTKPLIEDTSQSTSAPSTSTSSEFARGHIQCTSARVSVGEAVFRGEHLLHCTASIHLECPHFGPGYLAYGNPSTLRYRGLLRHPSTEVAEFCRYLWWR